MKMIWHQAVANHSDLVTHGMIEEKTSKEPEIFGIDKDGLPVCTTVENVVANAGLEQFGAMWRVGLPSLE